MARSALTCDAMEHRSIDIYRQVSLCLAAVSVLIASVMFVETNVQLDPSGAASILLLFAAALLVSRLYRPNPQSSRMVDAFGALGLVWTAGLACGLISLMGLRLHLPLVDNLLLWSDHAIGFDSVRIVEWFSLQPRWLIMALKVAYTQTVPIVMLSIVVLSVLGERVAVWRAAFCFVGSLLSICLLSIATPAKGLSVWASDALMARFPDHFGRYFWATFDRFYQGADPVLGVSSIDGVVSFPSFHTAMGLIVLTMWSKRPLTLALAGAWLLLMLSATLPLGGHYVVDLLGGAAIWAIWFMLSRWVEKAPTASVLAQKVQFSTVDQRLPEAA